MFHGTIIKDRMQGKRPNPEQLRASHCKHFGKPVRQIAAGTLSCGSSVVTLYRCDRFNELISVAPIRGETRDTLIELEDDYSGRSCASCPHRNAQPIKVVETAQLTICITRYMREESLRRLLASIERYYPDLPYIVEDTGGNLSKGRNAVIAKAATPYVMICEEDFEFTGEPYLETLLMVLEQDKELGGASGYVELPNGHKYRRCWADNMTRFRGKMEYSRPTEWRVALPDIPYLLCDLLPNAGVWRREVFADYPWDEDLEIVEHREWFWRLKQGEQWKCAFVPSVKLDHHNERPTEEYRKMRGRVATFRPIADRKAGAVLGKARGFLLEDLTRPQRPNVIILGIGHANTSITTEQIEALGWNLGHVDRDYAEHIGVRDINMRYLSSNEFMPKEAREVLERIPEPWAIKDPRFAKGALSKWLPLLVPYTPLLLWIVKDKDAMLKSYEDRRENMTKPMLEKQLYICRQTYESWPWAKLKLTAEQIGEACRLFDPTRRESNAN